MCGEEIPDNVVRGQAGRGGQLRVADFLTTDVWCPPGHIGSMVSNVEQLSPLG
jgi:hypothetical protein